MNKDKEMKKPPPTVSVVMPVYNAAKYLADALDSLLAQTYSDFEVVAVDDGSTDETPEALRQYAERDPRIRVTRQANRGCGAARNSAILLARGRYIAAQDADDLSAPTRLEKQAAFLDSHPVVAAVYCRTVMTDEELNPLLTLLVPEGRDAMRKALRSLNALQPNYMMRRETMTALGGYREALLYSQDYDMNLRLTESFHVRCLPEALYIYRTHGAQSSVASNRRQNEFSALVKAFAVERLHRGADGYERFCQAGDVERFVQEYEFKSRFAFFAGDRSLRKLNLKEARKYLKRALKEKPAVATALLLAKSYLPRPVIKAYDSLKNRFLHRQWTRLIPEEISKMLSGKKQ